MILHWLNHDLHITTRIGLLLVIALMAACTGPTEELEPPQAILIDESNNGRRVELQLGETLVLQLGSNPSTGYLWEIQELDENVLRQLGESTFESLVPDNPPPGTGGWETFRFEAVGEGETPLQLLYYQPWTEEDPTSTYSVQVLVH